MSRDTSPDKEEEEQEDKIYIDERILAKNSFFLNNVNGTPPKFDTVYDINGEIFREEKHNDNDSHIEFEVQLNNLNDDATDVEETETVDIYFEIISYQEINEGVIINSYIFLTLNQWNTLIVVENYKFCFVCDKAVDSLEHIKMVTHMENLERSRPLKKFDLAITRLIGESYHCAVCNVIFHISNEKDHFNSENHKFKMEHARNRTLELTESGNYVNEYKSSEASEDDESSNDIDLNNENNENKGNNDKDLNNEIKENNENNTESISYAAMVKKPNTTPKYITFTVGDITYNISFDHWHMIIYPRANQFYCMTCKAFGHISSKTAHCSHINHTIKLSYCHFVEKYHRFLIRQIFLDKFYHCGICNKIILTSEVDDHIINVHDEKFVNPDIVEAEKNNAIQNKFDERYVNNGYSRNRNNGNNDVSRNKNNDVPNNFHKTNYYKINICRELLEINNTSPGLYNDIVLYQFFCKLRISFGAFNIILKSMQGLFCGVCNIVLNEEAMKYHLIDFNHVERIRALPFEAYFGVNLIRLVNNRMHCAICNVLLDNIVKTLSHITCKPHRALLNQSLNGSENATPVNPEDSKNQKGQIDSNQFKHQPKMQENKIESNEHSESSDDSIESNENYEHEFIYLHFKNKYIKVTFNAYHSLVAIGDGTRYCFVCSTLIIGCPKMHIDSRGHTVALKKSKFLDKFDKHLLRQIYVLYHCCTCNVIFTKKYLIKHLTWPIQEVKTSKTLRKYDFSIGIKLVRVQTQKEEIFLNMQESKMEIIGTIDIKQKLNHVEIKKTNKIIILNTNVLKLSWDSWQGILNKKNGYFCILCDKDLKNFELNYHISEEWHANALENAFDKNYFPNLIRKVNDTTVHCLTCNQVIPNKGYYILDHVNSKKHNFTYNSIRDYSATVKSYSDCNDNVLYLSN